MSEVTGGAAIKKRFFIASLRTYDLLNVVVLWKLQHNCTSLSILDERCRFRSLNGVKCLRAADAVSTTVTKRRGVSGRKDKPRERGDRSDSVRTHVAYRQRGHELEHRSQPALDTLSQPMEAKYLLSVTAG